MRLPPLSLIFGAATSGGPYVAAGHAPPCAPSPRPLSPLPASVASAAEEAFEAATTPNDLVAAFSRLEAALPPSDKRLTLACLKLGQHLEASASADPSRVLSLALCSLRILEASPSSATSYSDAVSLAMALHLAGSSSFDLPRFHDALSFLSRSLRFLSPLLPSKDAAFGEEGSDFEAFDVRPVVHMVRLQLANVKTALGRREKALADLRACLELKESILPLGSRELGAAYRDLAEAHAAVLDFNQALSLCQKALELHESTLGKNSVEAHEQALQENEMPPPALLAPTSPARCMCKRGMAGDALKMFDEMLEREIDKCSHVYKTTTSNRHEGCSVWISQI